MAFPNVGFEHAVITGSDHIDVAVDNHGFDDSQLAALKPRVLAAMHGSSFSGDGAAALRALGDHYDILLRTALADRKLS